MAGLHHRNQCMNADHRTADGTDGRLLANGVDCRILGARQRIAIGGGSFAAWTVTNSVRPVECLL